MKLHLTEDYVIDTDDYRKEGLRIAILAMSGHGKSNAAADIVEDVLDQQGQVIVIEPISEWHTLKARYNNVVTVGGEYQDLPLQIEFAREYVHASLENGVNLVLNISDIEDDYAQHKLIADFLWNLYRSEQKYRRVVFLAIEEADTWAPQMWDQKSKDSLARVSLIAKHGRKIGIFPIFITQRPADFHKSPLSQCNVILFGKFTSSADLDPKTGIMYVIKKLHIPLEEKDIISLETGGFIAWDKFGVHKVKVRKRSCPHGADTPLVAPVPFASGVNQSLRELRESIEKALEAKRKEKSLIDRLQADLKAKDDRIKELEKKADIKMAVSEMFKGESAPKETPDLRAKIEELTKVYDQRIGSLEADSKAKTDRVLALESEKAALEEKFKAYESLDKALAQIISLHIPTNKPSEKIVSTEQPALSLVGIPRALQIEHEETPVIINHAEGEPQKVSTKTLLGKLLYTALVDIKDEFTEAELSEKMLERGWNISHSTLAPSLGNLVKQGDLVRINGKPAKYRLPYKKKFDVQGGKDEEQERQLPR